MGYFQAGTGNKCSARILDSRSSSPEVDRIWVYGDLITIIPRAIFFLLKWDFCFLTAMTALNPKSPREIL